MVANVFTANELELLAALILSDGSITSLMQNAVSADFISKTNEELKKGISLLEDHSKAADYERNLRQFSILKQQTILKEYKGTKLSLDELTGRLDTLHNVHLKTEIRTAAAQAEAVELWDKIEKEAKVLPLLEYITSDDSKVRPEHAELDGIIRPVKDRFWSTYLPPLGYNCRCDTLQLNDSEDSIVNRDSQTFDRKEALKGVAPGLANNPARSGEIFSKAHPYFNNGTSKD